MKRFRNGTMQEYVGHFRQVSTKRRANVTGMKVVLVVIKSGYTPTGLIPTMRDADIENGISRKSGSLARRLP